MIPLYSLTRSLFSLYVSSTHAQKHCHSLSPLLLSPSPHSYLFENLVHFERSVRLLLLRVDLGKGVPLIVDKRILLQKLRIQLALEVGLEGFHRLEDLHPDLVLLRIRFSVERRLQLVKVLHFMLLLWMIQLGYLFKFCCFQRSIGLP